ncbi:MAG: hypothetical protein V4569_04455 [Pseudomonadota bacterium]
MILDGRTSFAQNASLNTGAPGAYVIGDVIDTGRANGVGPGLPLFIVIVVKASATSGGAATLALRLVSSTTGTINPATATAHGESPTFALAALVAGREVWTFAFPPCTSNRWWSLVQVTGGAAFTGGAITAVVTTDPTAWRAYAAART